MLEIKKIKTTDILLDLPEQQKEVESLQRNEDWHEKRRGNWTGSRVKNIMTCDRSASKLGWGSRDKIKAFSKGVMKYIYERAMERKTGHYSSTGATYEMRYGTRVEPLILAIASEMLGEKIDDVGYKSFNDFPSAGASADGKVKDAVIEAKACTSWNTHYDRTFEFTSDKSTDFWQMQTEMRAWNINKCYYFVAEPPKDIMKYLFYDGDIMDLLDDFKKECKVTMQTVLASELHQNALFKRIQICENVCSLWIENGGNLKDIFDEYIKNWGSDEVLDLEAIAKPKDIDDLPF